MCSAKSTEQAACGHGTPGQRQQPQPRTTQAQCAGEEQDALALELAHQGRQRTVGCYRRHLRCLRGSRVIAAKDWAASTRRQLRSPARPLHSWTH